MHKSSSIINFYKNRSVFITGATGFLGKVLVEKLLRSCNGIENIYVLIKPSKHQASPDDRLRQLLKSSIFDHLKTEDGSFSQKLITIPGDMTQENLGISKKNWLLLSEKVSVVFHVAATIKFNQRLNTALKLNLEGTRNVLSLCQSMKKLSSVVYVSTAYSNADRNKTPIEEIVYPLPFDSDSCHKFFDNLEQLQILGSITPKLLNGKPNTYVFSKHLAEKLVLRKASECNLPICIVRPSIIAPIHSDPVQLKGWVDNLNGLLRINYSVSHGLTFVSPGGYNSNFDVMPVDYVVKIMILAAWDTAMANNSNECENSSGKEENEVCKKNNQCLVYNACVDQFNRITHGEYTEYLQKSINATPSSWMVLPPSIKVTKESWWQNLNRILVGVPCMIMDSLYKLRGKESSLQELFKASEKSFAQIGYFRYTSFEFKSNNVVQLRSKIPACEKEIFDLNMEDIKWPEYVQNGVLGIRRYYDKDEDSTIPAAIKSLKRIRGLYFAILISIPVAISIPLCIHYFV